MDWNEFREKGLIRGFEIVRSLVAAPERWCYAHGLIDPDELPLPDFIGLGAQKAGSTWLYENLDAHPGVYMSRPKEVHYFDWNYYESLRSYARHFKRYPEGRIQGEITPDYSIIPRRRIEFVRRIMPDLKLLLLIRNPVERAWSHAYMNLVDNPGRRIEEVPDEEFVEHFRSERSVGRGRYGAIIDRWASVFGRERLHVDLYDRISREPRALLEGVFEHLGISTEVDWEAFPYQQVIHSSDKPEMPARFREVLAEVHEEDIRFAAEEFGGPAEEWLSELEAEREPARPATQ